MQTPTTQDIRDAVRAVAAKVSNGCSNTYTDRRANGRSRVTFLMPRYKMKKVEKYATRVNAELAARGFAPVMYAHYSNTGFSYRYPKLSGVCVSITK